MSKIHYFQRYVQRENVATNNTMLLFSRLYNSSIHKFNKFLQELMEDIEINMGVEFFQQEKGQGSVPDGTFSQESIKISIETKMHEYFSEEQLKNHLNNFSDEKRKFLIGLSPTKMGEDLEHKVTKFSNSKGIVFLNITFKDIVRAFRSTLFEYDIELIDIVDDYEEYCFQSGLISKSKSLMRVMLCGKTLDLNIKNGCYYNLAERGYKEHTYMGMYKEKAIRAFGKISNIVGAELVDGELKIINFTHKVTDSQNERIINMIIETKESLGWDISTKHEFFMIDKLHEIEFKKASKGAPLGAKFFDLKEYLKNDEISDENLIEFFNNNTWE